MGQVAISSIADIATIYDEVSAADERFRLALNRYNSADYDKALPLLLDSLNSGNPADIFALIGNCYWKLNDRLQAETFWEKAINIDSQNACAYINLGNASYFKQQLNEAIFHWMSASTIAPENTTLNLNLAIAYANLGYRLQSIKYYEKYLQYETNCESNLYTNVLNKINNLRIKSDKFLKRGSAYIKENRINQGAECFLQSISNYPLQAKTNINLSNIYAADKNYEQALLYCINAYILSDFSSDFTPLIANIYDNLKMHDYAYCFYMRASDAPSRMASNAVALAKRARLIYPMFEGSKTETLNKHLNLAKNLEATSFYELAFIEYENYLILSKNITNGVNEATNDASDNIENETVNEIVQIIERIRAFLKPEAQLKNTLTKDIELNIEKKNYAKAMQLCERMILLSNGSSKDLFTAKKKKRELTNLMRQ